MGTRITGSKLLWTGLTLINVAPVLNLSEISLAVVGAIVMAIGCLMMWMDR